MDTADSQVVDSKGPDFLSLANRTSLLGNLIATKPLRTAIGERAGVDPSTLVVVPPANTPTSTTGGVGLTPTPVIHRRSRHPGFRGDRAHRLHGREPADPAGHRPGSRRGDGQQADDGDEHGVGGTPEDGRRGGGDPRTAEARPATACGAAPRRP